MRTLNAIVRWACLVAGLCGVVISAWAFIDPGAFPQMQSSAAFAPPSSRGRAAVGVQFSRQVVG